MKNGYGDMNIAESVACLEHWHAIGQTPLLMLSGWSRAANTQKYGYAPPPPPARATPTFRNLTETTPKCCSDKGVVCARREKTQEMTVAS